MRASFLLLLAVFGLSACVDFEGLRTACEERGDCAGAAQPPTLDEVSPANQATDVRLDTTLTLRFSRAMEPASVTLAVSPPVALAAPTWSDEDTTLTVQPQAPLAAATRYSVVVTGRAADGVGLAAGTSFSFTTQQAPDVTAPTLVATVPAQGATSVPIASGLSLTFSEPMAAASVVVELDPSWSPGEPTWSADERTVAFTAPPEPLWPLVAYQLTVQGTDLAGNALTGTTLVQFTTAAPPDTAGPTVVGTTPPAGATGVETSLAPTLSFSEPMDRAATLAAVSLTPAVDGGVQVVTDSQVAPTQFTFTHAQPLAGNTTYTLSVSTGARDLVGNALPQSFTASFTTGTTADVTPPTILSVTPAHQATGAAYQPSLVITFSEAMDPAATQQAVQVSMPVGITGTPTWSSGNTVLTWAFNQALSPGQQVRWQVSQTARDLSGNQLGQTALYEFLVRRRQVLTVQGSDVTTGAVYQRSDGTFGVSASFRVGDLGTSTANTLAYRGLVSFALGGLPAALLDVERADLTLGIDSVSGAPLNSLRPAVVHCFSKPLTPSTTTAQDLFLVNTSNLLCSTGPCARGANPDVAFFSVGVPGAATQNIGAYVDGSLEGGVRTAQCRVVLKATKVFPYGSDPYVEFIGTSGSDYVELATTASTTLDRRPKLVITYAVP